MIVLNKLSLNNIKYLVSTLEYVAGLYASYINTEYLTYTELSTFPMCYDDQCKSFRFVGSTDLVYYKVKYGDVDVCIIAVLPIKNADKMDITYNCIQSRDTMRLQLYRCVVMKDSIYFTQIKFIVDNTSKMLQILDSVNLPTCDWMHIVSKYVSLQQYEEHMSLSDYDIED